MPLLKVPIVSGRKLKKRTNQRAKGKEFATLLFCILNLVIAISSLWDYNS